MARAPTNVKLNEVELINVVEVQLSAERESGALGQALGNTKPLRLIIIRDASKMPQIDGFKLATNGDGRDVEVTAEFTVVNNEGNPAYHFKADRAVIAGWQIIRSGAEEQLAREVIELNVGKATLTAGPKPASFELKNYGSKSPKK
jgi:hypothetical protein